MPLWGNKNSANNNLVKNKPTFFQHANNAYVNEALYNANTSVVQGKTGVVNGGWTTYRPGTGHVISVAVGTAGSAYTNGDFVTYSGGMFNPANNTFYTGTFVTSDYVTTNGSGGIVSITTGLSSALWSNNNVAANVTTGKISSVSVSGIGASALPAGTYYLNFSNTAGLGANVSVSVLANGAVNATSASVISGGHGYLASAVASLTGSTATFTITPSIGTGCALTATVGGKVGRKFYETVVALGNIVEDGVGGSGPTLP